MKLRALVLLFLRFVFQAAAVATIFDTPGSSLYLIPPNTHYLGVCCTGGGGSGANGKSCGGGGGGGGMTICARVAVLSAINATVNIGAGGAPNPGLGANGTNGVETTFTIDSRTLYAASGGGGLCTSLSSGGTGAGGGEAGTSNANLNTGGSSTPSATWNWIISVTGRSGPTSCAYTANSGSLTTGLFTSPGFGGAGCYYGDGGPGAPCQGSTFSGGAGGNKAGIYYGGGGGGASAWANGGNAAGSNNQTAAAGSRGSGGGGGYGIAGNGGVGGAGGDGYCIITPED